MEAEAKIASAPNNEQVIVREEEILAMRPDQLAEHLRSLDEVNGLEAFLNRAAESPELSAQLSYWEKWLEKSNAQLLDQLIQRKRESYGEASNSLPLQLEKKFTPEELQLIFSNLKGIQLTFGCSKGCPLCAFDAVPGIREHIPYSQLANLFQQYGHDIKKGKPMLYWASEPSDYASREGLEDRTYEDVHELAARYADYDPHITSRNLYDEGWLRFMGQSKNQFFGRRLSTYGLTELQTAAMKEKMQSANVEVRTAGDKLNFYKGMGRSATDEEFLDARLRAGIGCVDGMLLTPRGLYNVIVVPISKDFPQGNIIQPIVSILSDPIEVGQNIKEVMKRSVIRGRFSAKSKMDITSSDQGTKLYAGEIPKGVLVHTKDELYYIKVDKEGLITHAEKFSELPLIKAVPDAIRGKLQHVSVDLKGHDPDEIISKAVKQSLESPIDHSYDWFDKKLYLWGRFKPNNNAGFVIDLEKNEAGDITGVVEVKGIVHDPSKMDLKPKAMRSFKTFNV